MSNHDVASLEEARNYIDAIDFSKIINKMVERDGWLKSDALKVCKLYRRYLYLRRKYSEAHRLPPTKEIDEFWHYHILETKKYRNDCQVIFGEYHDHYPYFGFDDVTDLDDLSEAFQTTQKLYGQEFNGEKIYKVRNKYSKIVEFIKKWSNRS